MARKTEDRPVTSIDKTNKHDELTPLLKAMFKEFQDATKKKPDGVLNKKKVSIVNRLLTDIFAILEGESMRPYLDLLDEDDLPQNSDVSLMLSQTVAAMEAFRSKYHGYDQLYQEHKWFCK